MSIRPRHPPEPARQIMSRGLGANRARPARGCRRALSPRGHHTGQAARCRGTAAAVVATQGRRYPDRCHRAVAVVGGILVVVSGGESPPPQPAGPLDGTYAVEFAAATRPTVSRYDNAPSGRETWVIKSACPANGCVATATKVDGSQSNRFDNGARRNRWPVEGGQHVCENMPERPGRLLGGDVPSGRSPTETYRASSSLGRRPAAPATNR